MNSVFKTGCPFIGLKPFSVEDSFVFFGRNEEIDTIAKQLAEKHCAFVIGGPGTGKTSLVTAGLFSLLKGGFFTDNTDWLLFTVKPRNNPLFYLASELLSQSGDPEAENNSIRLVEDLKEKGIEAVFDTLDRQGNGRSNLLLFVDQFEDIFINDALTEEVKNYDIFHFVNILHSLINRGDARIYIVVAMRTNFLDNCSAFYGLQQLINTCFHLVAPFRLQQLKEAIEGPTRMFGKNVSPGLVNRIVNDLSGEQFQLSLLQFTLKLLWESTSQTNDTEVLDMLNYERVGGVNGAISNYCNGLLQSLSERQVYLAKKIFQTLSFFDDTLQYIQKAVTLPELADIINAEKGELDDIIHFYSQYGKSLLSIHRYSEGTVVEKYSEVLLVKWDLLTEWVNEERDAASALRTLTEYARQHTEKTRGLLDETEFTYYDHWFRLYKPTAAWAKRYTPYFDQGLEYYRNSAQVKINKELEIRRRKIFITVGFAVLILIICFLVYAIIRLNSQH